MQAYGICGFVLSGRLFKTFCFFRSWSQKSCFFLFCLFLVGFFLCWLVVAVPVVGVFFCLFFSDILWELLESTMIYKTDKQTLPKKSLKWHLSLILGQLTRAAFVMACKVSTICDDTLTWANRRCCNSWEKPQKPLDVKKYYTNMTSKLVEVLLLCILSSVSFVGKVTGVSLRSYVDNYNQLNECGNEERFLF